MSAGVNLPNEYRRGADYVDSSPDVTLFAIEGYRHLSRPQLPVVRLPRAIRGAARNPKGSPSATRAMDGVDPEAPSRASPRVDRSRLAGDARGDPRV
jgi:hypothetical protein